jgi:hypothetical protein
LWLNLCSCSPYESSLMRGWVCLLWIGFASVKCTYGYGECIFFSESSPIKVIIWSKEPLMGFEMCLWEQSNIYM